MKYKSINELCKGEDGTNIKRVLKNCNDLRSINRHYRNGYTNDRGRTHRLIACLPEEIFLNPNSPLKEFFDLKNMDRHERKKHMTAFFKKYPEFLVVDKM